MESGFQVVRICQIETRRWIMVVGVLALTYILLQSLLLPYGTTFRSLVPDRIDPGYDLSRIQALEHSAVVLNPLGVGTLLAHANGSVVDVVVEDVDGLEGGLKEDSGDEDGLDMVEEGADNLIDVVVDSDVACGDEDDGDDIVVEDVVNRNGTLELDVTKAENSKPVIELEDKGRELSLVQDSKLNFSDAVSKVVEGGTLQTEKKLGVEKIADESPPGKFKMGALVTITTYSQLNGSSSAASAPWKNEFMASENNEVVAGNLGKKKMRSGMPPKSIMSIGEMNRILARRHRSSRAMRPRWSSLCDQEIFAARLQIDNASLVVNDRDLYAPVFRNVSEFKRSYELMERVLKVYIYKEGKKPIFHVPVLKGLYASEGWFMKLLRENKHYLVKDPEKAHLFYLPFSSRMLEYALYVPNSRNRTNLRLYLKEYSEKLAAKYPYWNRTGGADHFLVACHDWAPYETRHHMELCIKALCNADVMAGFKIGRDVSLPETYVRTPRNPLRDLGGKPPSQRRILAFYAGNIHGYLRSVLLEYWKDKDPDMKIFGPMPLGVARKMNYIQHMKSSKYCICPKGYEVNSPRVVEAIFYECVPVIISDNFVPPFFDIIDWGAFSLILAEKDIPNLKEILLSVPEEKYLQLQLGVRKVQRHFLWHTKPVKYDLFHMTLHSIWYNRVYQLKPR